MKNNYLFIISCFLILTSVFSQEKKQVEKRDTPTKRVKSKDWVSLLDKEMSQWEVWTGVPHKSVKNLPKGYIVPEDGKPIEAIGLDNSMNVFSTSVDQKRNVVLNISGLIYGGLTTKKEYENYHLTMLYKWGVKKFAPRLKNKRDSGLLYHCYGEHGAFWKVWKKCIELQIQESDFGDLYTLQGTSGKTNTLKSEDGKNRWTRKGKPSKGGKRGKDAESKYGKWTRVDLYVIGDKAIHVVNGEVVLAVYDLKNHEGEKLTAGQIQIQSEGAEAYAKDIFIRPLKKFPKKIKKKAGYK